MDNAAVAEEALGAQLDAHADIVGVYSLGAGNRGVIAALRKRGLAGKICVIAHELTAHSRAALNDGVFAAIRDQDPGHEARSAIQNLARARRRRRDRSGSGAHPYRHLSARQSALGRSGP